MRTIIVFLVFFSLCFPLAAQQDPEAKVILDRMAEKLKQCPSILSDFSLIVFDHKENKKNTSNGTILIKGDKYKVASGGTTVYYNGTTMWTYAEDDNEVTITEPDSQDDDLLSNPAKVFTFYERDFKYLYRGETTIDSTLMDEIDLFPRDLDQPYSRFKVFIAQHTGQLAILSAIGKDGVDYSVFLKNMVTNKVFPDAVFTFEPSKHKRITVVDMRGL
jgi:outer membrane lipoprotein-sorting protein